MIVVLAADHASVTLRGVHTVTLSWPDIRAAAWQEDRGLRHAYAAAWARALAMRATASVEHALRERAVTSCMGWSYRGPREDATRLARGEIARAEAEIAAWCAAEERAVVIAHAVEDRGAIGEFRDQPERRRGAESAERRHYYGACAWMGPATVALARLSDRLREAEQADIDSARTTRDRQ